MWLSLKEKNVHSTMYDVFGDELSGGPLNRSLPSQNV